jgi:Starch-binding associating with outer membrane
MMNRRILRVGTGLAFAFVAAACNSDKLTNLNKNPNSPEDVPPGPLFTNAARLSVSRWLGTAYDLRQTEWVAQHLAEVQYNDEDRYLRIHASDTEASFNGAYPGELKDFAQIIAKGTASNSPGTYAPAQAMRTWEFSYLTLYRRSHLRGKRDEVAEVRQLAAAAPRTADRQRRPDQGQRRDDCGL